MQMFQRTLNSVILLPGIELQTSEYKLMLTNMRGIRHIILLKL